MDRSGAHDQGIHVRRTDPQLQMGAGILLRESYREGDKIKNARSPICRLGQVRRLRRCAKYCAATVRLEKVTAP
jgi:hypothetical protein